MLRWTDLTQIPTGYGPSVVTLGNFDGVHRGHRAVLERVVREAAARSGPGTPVRSVAVTFEPHPVAVLHPERAPELLTGLADRLELMAATGIDATLVLEFTHELAQLTAEQFATDVFARALGATALVVGRDTRLGVHNSGNVDDLRRVGTAEGFEVIALDDLGDPGQARWSSSRTRALLADGDVARAAEVLGRPHRVRGVVVHGHHRGAELGYPTANLSEDSTGMVPADGVYAGWFERPDVPPGHPDRRLPAAISVGTNPTFRDVLVRTVEAYVLDRTDLDLYGEHVAVDFVRRLRGMDRFDSVQELRAQMARDVEHTRGALGLVGPAVPGHRE